MSHRRNEYLERLQEHMEEREWTNEDKEHFLHMIGHSALLSTQSALSVLEFQQLTDERIEAEKEHDRWAIAREMTVIERTDTAQLDQTIPGWAWGDM